MSQVYENPYQLDSLRQAQRTVYSFMQATPCYEWPQLSTRLKATAFVKHENHAPLGAFKVRGGATYFESLMKRDPNCTGVISATRGNHGQSVGLAARRSGISATIVVPHGNSLEKNAAMRSLGVNLIEHGSDFQESRVHAMQLAQERGLHMIPSFHEDLVRGVASYWLEFFESVPSLNRVYVPIGMGSGACAAIAARDALNRDIEIVGVVSAHAQAYALSIAGKQVIEAPVTTVLADGMACRSPDPDALAMLIRGIDTVVQVTDDEVANAMRIYFSDTHNVAEGAGAAALAAALQDFAKRPATVISRVLGLTLCGGNVDSEVFAKVLAH